MEKERSDISNYLHERSQSKLDLESLQEIDPKTIVEHGNSVITKILDSLSSSKSAVEKKITMTKAIIIDLFASLMYGRFVSPLCLATSILNYAYTGSRKSVDILSHLVPCGSYTFLSKFLSTLSEKQIAGPDDVVLAYAFDNNQRLQKVWLSRNNNKQTLEIMTNILRVEWNGKHQFDKSLCPSTWRLFNNETLGNFSIPCLSNFDLLTTLSVNVSRRLSDKNFGRCSNEIDEMIKSEIDKNNFIICNNCATKWPKRKIKCDTCKTNIRALPDNTAKSTRIDNSAKKDSSLKFHHYIPIPSADSSCYLKRTTSFVDFETSGPFPKKIKTPSCVLPKMSLIDPVFVNPASKSSLKLVLDKIGEDAGIERYGNGTRQWVFVVCDGSPMSLLWKIIFEDIEKYSWVVPITGLGHEEMNMVKSFVEIYYDFILKDFFKSQGYSTPKSLAFAKAACDHHIAFDNLMKFREALWDELVYQFNEHSGVENKTFESFSEWIKETEDRTLINIFNHLLPFLESIFIFRDGVRNNDPTKIRLARNIFRPIWYARNHHKYILIDFFDLCSRELMPDQILNFLNTHESISASGRIDAHQGLDFILEEYNKNIKKHICGIANSSKWEKVIRNFENLNNLREETANILSIKDDDRCPRQTIDFQSEKNNFRVILRRSSYLFPQKGRKLVTIDNTVKLSDSFHKFSELATIEINNFFSKFCQSFNFPNKLNIRKIPVTKFEEDEMNKDRSRSKAELLAMIDENMIKMPDDIRKDYMSKKKVLKISTAKKDILIEFLNEIRQVVSERLTLYETAIDDVSPSPE